MSFFSGVKLSIRSFVLIRASFQIHSCFMSQGIAIVTSVNSIEVNRCNKSLLLNRKPYTLICFAPFNFNSCISEFRAKTKPLLIPDSHQNLRYLLSRLYTFISCYLKKIIKIGFPELEKKFLQRFRSFFSK